MVDARPHVVAAPTGDDRVDRDDDRVEDDGPAGGPGRTATAYSGAPSSPPLPRRALGAMRAHALFVVALAAGIAMRVITVLAYGPAFFYPDSHEYLAFADQLSFTHVVPDSFRPLGYSGYLAVFLPTWDPMRNAVIVQHLLGLIVGTLIYAALVRVGVRRWLAVIGSLPLLLDSFQLDLEHYIMADVLCQSMAATAFVLLIWHRRATPVWAAVGVGLLLSAGVVTRYAAVALIVPAVAYLLLRGGGLRLVGTRAAAMLVAFVLPLGAYAVLFHHFYGKYSITANGGRFLYGRVGPLADCAKFTVPDYERPLCLSGPGDPRRSTNFLIWSPKTPFFTVEPPAGMTQDQVAADFAKRAVRAQPLTFAKSVLKSYASSLRPTRTGGGSQYWRFQRAHPLVGVDPQAISDEFGGGRLSYRHRLTGFLVHYTKYVNWPGTLDAVAVVLAALAAFGIGAARRSGLRILCAVFALAGFAAVLPNDLLSIFGWRYHLQSLPLFPVAGVLAVAALWRGGRTDPVE